RGFALTKCRRSRQRRNASLPPPERCSNKRSNNCSGCRPVRSALLVAFRFFLGGFVFLLRLGVRRQRRHNLRWRRGIRRGRFFVFFRLLLFLGQQVLPLFQQRVHRPFGDKISPFLEPFFLFQLLLELGQPLLEFLVELLLVFGFFIFARRAFP